MYKRQVVALPVAWRWALEDRAVRCDARIELAEAHDAVFGCQGVVAFAVRLAAWSSLVIRMTTDK